INKKYSKTKFAVFGCGDSSYTNFCGAVLHLEEFVQKTGGKLVTDSLRIDGFFFDMDKSINLTKEWTKRLNDKINGLNYTLLKNDDDEQKNALLVRLQQLSNIPLSERLIN
ncbi:MAG TPA: flavodoxin domain-containing protein, partial [Candidatus Nitrosocosmicus sp.]|nr:flavodoxin domain-containing protein [Candidatus Nitrosocosmicus sp.]